MRYKLYVRAVTKNKLFSEFILGTLPLTTAAVRQLSFCTYHTVQQWSGNTRPPIGRGWLQEMDNWVL